MKVVQVMYAYYQNGERNLSSAERELSESVNSAYSLYHTLLYLLVALRRYSLKQITRKQKMNDRVSRKELLFAENRLMSQLENNESLISYIGTDDMSWLTDFVKGLYDQIMDSEELEEYYQEDVFDYESDKYLCRKLYRKFIENNEQLDDVLEQANIYWNGDKNLIDSFVQKTLKTFEEKNGAEQPLLRAFKDEDSREFAMNLLRSSIERLAKKLKKKGIKNSFDKALEKKKAEMGLDSKLSEAEKRRIRIRRGFGYSPEEMQEKSTGIV